MGICCTLFLCLNADVILFCFMLPLFTFISVMRHNLIVCSPELLLQHFKIAGLQVLWSTAGVMQTCFLKGRISLCLNNRKTHSGQENFGLILSSSSKRWKCMWKQHYTFHSLLFSRLQPFLMLCKSFVWFSIQNRLPVQSLWSSL